MNKTIVILASCTAIGSIAFAQGKPAEKPAAPTAAAAKPTAAPTAAAMKPASPAAAKPAAAPGAKPGEPGMKPGEHGAKPGAPGTAGPAAAAAAPAMPPMPKPPAELDEAFKYFYGAWKCDTRFPAGAMGPGSPEMIGKSTVKFKKAIGGWYVQGDYQVKKTKTMPGMKGSMMISYHPVAKMFAITAQDDMGSAAYETATGYQGETITFSGEGFMMGQKVKIRETMTRGPDKAASHKYEVDMGKGFQLMGEDTCKR